MKLSEGLLRYLELKGILGTQMQRRFLYPRLSDHHDPFLMRGMEQAIEVLRRAIKGHLKILVWGHADLDGIASAAMLKSAIEDLGSEEVAVRIPFRESEEFGLIGKELIEFREKGINLVVTVDVGVTNVDEARQAREIGMDLLITDHHELVGQEPDAVIVNPKIPQCGYPFKQLAGAGVVLKIVSALYGQMVGLSLDELSRLRPQYWMFAALGTVSDRCPLVDENRLIVKIGLAHLRAGEWPSLEVWLEEMGLDAESLTVFDLYSKAISAFYAADSEEGVRILLSMDRQWLKTRYGELKELALQWQRGKQWMIDEALRIARNAGGMMVAASGEIGEDYLGTAAHALREYFEMPAIVMCPRRGLWHAECRGLDEIDLLGHLSRFKDMFTNFGGHRKACGFTLKPDVLDEFLEALNKDPLTTPSSAASIKEPAFELPLQEDLKDWQLLAPFGEGNPPPRLVERKVKIEAAQDGYRVNGVPVYLPFSLRSLLQASALFDVEYTIKADGTIRLLKLDPL